MNHASVTTIKYAHTTILDVEYSFNNGGITRFELNKLLREKDKFNHLLKASKVTIDLRYYEEVLLQLDDQFEAIKTLFHSLRPSCVKG